MEFEELQTPMRVLQSIFHHIALPAKLPSGSESYIDEIELGILDRLIIAVKHMRDVQPYVSWQIWDSIRRTLLFCKTLHMSRRLERSQLISHLRGLGNSDLVILHVKAQNAGVLIHKPTDLEFRGNILFETFEASPKREDVLASQTLSWKFPGTAVLVPCSVFYEDSFLENLSAFLEQSSVESTQKFSEYITKAGRAVAEDRETPDPALITSFFTAFLEANGRRISPKVLSKRVKDDVCWFDRESPWRRLPYWLVLRVSIARYLALMMGGIHGRIQYKFLMCLVHGIVLNDTHDAIDLEDQDFLKRKLCRRLYKLDRDCLGHSKDIQESCKQLTEALMPQLNRIIGASSTRIASAWDKEQPKITRVIPPLPRRAKSEDQRLSLTLSRGYLDQARNRFRDADLYRRPQTYSNAHQSKVHIQAFGNKLLGLFDEEKQIRDTVDNMGTSPLSLSARVRKLHAAILHYIDKIEGLYDNNAEQKSNMIITVMEMWKSLDDIACTLFPILYDFHPVFTPRLMEVLHLPLVPDVARVRNVQSYIQSRITRCGGTRSTLFDDPGRGCFADRYFDDSPGAAAVANLLAEIQATSASQREEKEKEWRELNGEYERLTKQFESATCIYVPQFDSDYPVHNPHSCPKCQLDNQRSRMVIRAFESPLPEDPIMAKAVVFELRCPETLAAYRDATWAILYRVAKEDQGPGVNPKICLQEYVGLQPYSKVPGTISLASTIKPFMMTHYKIRKRFPVELSQVCLPNGLNRYLGYFDKATQSWPGRERVPFTFEHHCKLMLPKGSPFSTLFESPSFNVYGNGPSSYEITASYSSCPPGINPHEYMGFQSLLSGKRRRWLTILTELGSSNINLSTQMAVLLFDHLIHQTGAVDTGEELFGSIHYVFRDPSFCEAILRQLRVKLDGIASNWRETHLMEIVIMLALRVASFTALFTDTIYLSKIASSLILDARRCTLEWVDALKTAQNCQSYLLWAALLCKRTFASHEMAINQDFEMSELPTFLKCSVAVYDNIPDNIDSLGPILKKTYIRDLRMMYNLKNHIRRSFNLSGNVAILSFLQNSWPGAKSKFINSITFETDDWMQIELNDFNDRIDVIKFNYIFGILLINGEPLGKLPTDPKSTIILEELFGSQTSLMRHPSNSPGMTHVLDFKKEGYETHIGYDDGKLIIRAIKGTQVLELIPREVFRNDSDFDLPAPLLDNCIHWLDIVSGILEIRPKTKNIWRSHPQNWKLDIATSICSRFTPYTRIKETLVDPYCPLFKRVSNIFSWFEKPMHLTIYQPGIRYSLTVDMPRMILRWFVNPKSLLQCQHLRAEIDPSQCIGTWYGFDSKLVCRGLMDPQEQFVLVPLGPLKARKRGCHIQVCAQLSDTSSTVVYRRFKVNKTLGRIDCAAEPGLVYKKAEIHALTSFLLPDPLTGLTGIESSLAILNSGISQPWSPLTVLPSTILSSISRLSPKREYYPEKSKVMKKEIWDHRLPTMIQREEFSILVDQIVSQSTRLAQFHSQKMEPVEFPSSGDTHLNIRALHRRRLHERSNNYDLVIKKPQDQIYESRHFPNNMSLRYSNVLEAVSLIRNKPVFMSTIRDLALNLSQSLDIKGYQQTFERITLQDRLDVDIRHEWGPLVNMVKDMQDQYKLMFFIGILSFRSDANMPLIRILIAFAQWDMLKSLVLPDCVEYHSFRPGQAPQLDVLVKLIEPFQAPPPQDPPLMEYASSREQRKRWQARTTHYQNANADCKDFAQCLISEWPTPSPSGKNFNPDANHDFLLDLPAALENVRREWDILYRNYKFCMHLEEVQKVLDQRHSDIKFQKPAFVPSDLTFPIQQPGYDLPGLGSQLMRVSISKFTQALAKRYSNPRGKKAQLHIASDNGTSTWPSQQLKQIIWELSTSKSAIKQRYASDLNESLAVLKSRNSRIATVMASPRHTSHYTVLELQKLIRDLFKEIESALQQPTATHSWRQITWLQKGQLWPAISPVALLEQIRSTANCSFGSGMKETILHFALSITNLQREMRLQSYLLSKENARYEEELANLGHHNWRVEDYPDWLLLEVESDLLIRETQVEVALAITNPESRANSVLQLNMGEGKTSCIIPMVAVLLANGRNLVRVSVPKALLQQTAQLLHGRLGGLVGRETCHVPFSRKTSTKEDHIKLFQRIHRDIQKRQGVMLCLPEHQMSFMLSGLQRVLDQQIPEASLMIRVQKWLQLYARDVLDESDHTLAVKTQLIYPSGSQMTVDGHPHRWQVAEQLLTLMTLHLDDLAVRYPHSIEVVKRPQGGFPFIFFLRPDVENELMRRLRYDVCMGERGIIPIDSLEPADRSAIKEFLSGGKIQDSILDRINRLCPDRPHVKKTVYLLRGLFVHRILLMVLKKRYGVQYGLHPLRDPVAVPFHAKGVPSEQSEFGHVDVAILLTALSFYYRGISVEQTRQALEAVLKSDDPAAEYDKWIEDDDFPMYLSDWHSVNTDDSRQLTQIWGFVRYKVSVIDYFMNNFVFPKHAKQFRIRLQSNGWDIPLFNVQHDNGTNSKTLSTRRALTTGFSGTNDIKPLLPLTIRQDDLPSLAHTNAEVLTYLLQPRSRNYEIMVDSYQKRIDEDQFLNVLKRHDIRILIDSGAQILEKSNRELAETWLKVDGRATVALYFDGDSPWILSKQGARTPLLASPYADNLNEVLVYLDEAHTRGTDLKFGRTARAALTLGLGQTKDHTVQAAMRLRQLGTTQSVVFFAPPEVNQSIRDLCNKREHEKVSSYDVIRWLINNTCDGIEQLQPLYYSQGIDFCNRMQAADDFPDFLKDDDDRSGFIDAIRHKERQSLQQLYGPHAKAKVDVSLKSNPQVAGFVRELENRKKSFQDTGQAVHASALQEVEQERETEIEVEAVRQVKKPIPCTPLKFPGLHRDLETFARTGRLGADSHTFVHILQALSKTALGKKYKINHGKSSSQLFVSSEFERTVKLVFESANDNFLRPVQWILYTASPEVAVVVTPEEAELLIPILRETQRSRRGCISHLMTYAAPVTRRMMHFNQLKYFAMPPLPEDWNPSEWLTTELGYFAGRLYFDWSEYGSICRFLGIDVSAPGVDELDSSEVDTAEPQSTSAKDQSTEAFSAPSDSSDAAAKKCQLSSYQSKLTSKPYTFTQEYLAVRRRGQDFTHTPMGFLCSGKLLNQSSPFFRTEDTARPVGLVPMGGAQGDDADEEYAEEGLELGNHDPSAEVLDDEVQREIEYDESELQRGNDSGIQLSDDESQPSVRQQRKIRAEKRAT